VTTPVPAPDVLLVDSAAVPFPRLLEAHGYVVAVESSVLAALARPEGSRPRLVLLSARTVPRREAAAVRAIKELPRPPLVLLTGPSRVGAGGDDLRDAGADDILAEPYLPDELLARIRGLLEAPAARTPAPATREHAGSTMLPAGDPGDLLSDLAELQRGSPHLREIFDRLVHIGARRTGARRVSLLLYRRRRRELVVLRAIGLPAGPTIDTANPLGHRLSGLAAVRAEPLLVPDIETSPYRSHSNRGPYATHSCLLLPLIAGRRLVGVFCLADKHSGEPFREVDLKAVAPLVDQATISILTAFRFRRLRSLSILDDLTGLYNQRQLRRTGVQEFNRARRYHRNLAVAYLDLDHFKAVNDTYGHAFGDRALQVFARVLKETFRDSDTLLRRGGDEFAVFLPELPEEPARHIFARLRDRLCQSPVRGPEAGAGHVLTFSAGVAFFPQDARGLEALLSASDRALYAAKARGRDRTTFWSELGDIDPLPLP
jgi:diguanylate cyclase (GGDEF)-like protein